MRNEEHKPSFLNDLFTKIVLHAPEICKIIELLPDLIDVIQSILQ